MHNEHCACHHDEACACSHETHADGGRACPVKVYLAGLAVWNAKLHNLHWNVTGPAFVQVHEYTERLYTAVLAQYDQVAEMMKMRGSFPPVRLTEYLALSPLEETDARDFTVPEVIALVRQDMETMRKIALDIRAGAESMNDPLLAADFDGLLAFWGKELWFLDQMSRG